MPRAHEARRRVTATSTTLLGTIATALTDHNPWPRSRPTRGAFTIYLGNVWEWCSDWYADYADYSAAQPQDPTGPKSGAEKILRGGSWDDGKGFVRVSGRFRSRPTDRDEAFGFRCSGELR